jgi:hypothetical protein
VKQAIISGRVVVILVLASLAHSAAKRPLNFQITARADGEDQEATEAGFQTRNWESAHFGYDRYKASDGQRLDSKYGEFRTEDEATRYFDWSLTKAAQVITEGDTLDRKGNHVGRRAEVSLKPDRSSYAVMWTHGAMFREILAGDLAHAIALEKQYEN